MESETIKTKKKKNLLNNLNFYNNLKIAKLYNSNYFVEFDLFPSSIQCVYISVPRA